MEREALTIVIKKLKTLGALKDMPRRVYCEILTLRLQCKGIFDKNIETSYVYLAQQCSCSTSTIRNCIKRLEELKLITHKKAFFKGEISIQINEKFFTGKWLDIKKKDAELLEELNPND